MPGSRAFAFHHSKLRFFFSAAQAGDQPFGRAFGTNRAFAGRRRRRILRKSRSSAGYGLFLSFGARESEYRIAGKSGNAGARADDTDVVFSLSEFHSHLQSIAYHEKPLHANAHARQGKRGHLRGDERLRNSRLYRKRNGSVSGILRPFRFRRYDSARRKAHLSGHGPYVRRIHRLRYSADGAQEIRRG